MTNTQETENCDPSGLNGFKRAINLYSSENLLGMISSLERETASTEERIASKSLLTPVFAASGGIMLVIGAVILSIPAVLASAPVLAGGLSIAGALFLASRSNTSRRDVKKGIENLVDLSSRVALIEQELHTREKLENLDKHPEFKQRVLIAATRCFNAAAQKAGAEANETPALTIPPRGNRGIH